MPVLTKIDERWERLSEETTRDSQLKILYQWVVTRHVTMKEFSSLFYRILHDTTKPDEKAN